MACLPADVRALDFGGVDFPDPPYTDAVLQLWLDHAALLVDADCPSELVDKATCLLAAHLAAAFAKGGGLSASAGAVTAEAAGGLSRSYGSVMLGGSDAALSTTRYGQHFILLRDALPCQYAPLVLV